MRIVLNILSGFDLVSDNFFSGHKAGWMVGGMVCKKIISKTANCCHKTGLACII
jgi:hypothetical protein